MSESQTWDVPCYVCGHKLGSNKTTCGQAQAGKKAVKFPPCKWAHTDDKYVRKALAAAAVAEEQKKKEQEEAQATMVRYHAGQIDFDEIPEGMPLATDANFGAQDFDGAEVERAVNDGSGEEGDGGRGDAVDTAAGAPAPASATTAQGNGGKTQKHTKWSSTTRTIFYKCIQSKDPFHTGHKDKTPAWEEIAKAMQEATRHLGNTAEGDLRCYGNGKTLQVFYGRMKRSYKEHDEDDKHSGTAGRQDEEDDKDPSAKMKKEEREQLFACIDLEKSADLQVQLKRDASKSFDFMKNGVVNDFVVECATKDEKVNTKLVKELSSRLRQAKMRKLAFEASNKGGTYTYTAEDMENFRLWDKVREAHPDLPEGECIDDDVSASKRGGHLVAALQDLAAQGAQLRQHFTPMSPSDFASEFFKAKRAHAEATKLTLKAKLEMVDGDVRDGTITQVEAQAIKKKIKDEHYTFGSP